MTGDVTIVISVGDNEAILPSILIPISRANDRLRLISEHRTDIKNTSRHSDNRGNQVTEDRKCARL